jgi:hypothetical protein
MLRKYIYIFIICSVILISLDIITTNLLISKYSIEHELNPISRYFMYTYRELWFLCLTPLYLLYITLASLIIYLAYRVSIKLVLVELIIFLILPILTVVNNISVLLVGKEITPVVEIYKQLISIWGIR